MLAETVEAGETDWDVRLPYILFSCCSSLQESTQESPFVREGPRLPMEETLVPQEWKSVVLGGYTEEVTERMSAAWEMARHHVRKAQERQKQQCARPATFSCGDRVFAYMPAKVTGKTRKFTRPYHAPTRSCKAVSRGWWYDQSLIQYQQDNSSLPGLSSTMSRGCARQILA